MIKKKSFNSKRVKRHQRIRNKISGTSARPRLAVYRSNKNISAQLIDDVTGTTLVSASTLDKAIAEKLSYTGNKEAAKLVGEAVAKKAIEKEIKSVVFDRAGYVYHGRVKELADGARAAGLEF